jgi:hypothetical protein
MRVTVIATGFDQKAEAKPAAGASNMAARPVAVNNDIDDIFSLFRR